MSEPQKVDPIAIMQQMIDNPDIDQAPPYVKGMNLEGSLFKEVSKGRFLIEWTIEPHLTHFDGFVQGGIVNVIADAGQSFAFWAASDGSEETYSTAEFSTRFFRPLKGGETFLVESIVLNRSRRMGVIETTFIHKETGKLHAKVTGSWMLVKRDLGPDS